MSTVDAKRESTTTADVGVMDMKLEVVVYRSLTSIARSASTTRLGWRLDADLAVDDGYRVVQVTPPGSACSVIFGEGVSPAPPGSSQGLQLSVRDIDQARADLVERGVDVSEPFHDAAGIFHHADEKGG